MKGMKPKSPDTFDPRKWTSAEALFHFSELSGEDLRPYRAKYDWKTDTFYLWRKKDVPKVEIYFFYDSAGGSVPVAECWTEVPPERTPFVKGSGDIITMAQLVPERGEQWAKNLEEQHQQRAGPESRPRAGFPRGLLKKLSCAGRDWDFQAIQTEPGETIYFDSHTGRQIFKCTSALTGQPAYVYAQRDTSTQFQQQDGSWRYAKRLTLYADKETVEAAWELWWQQEIKKAQESVPCPGWGRCHCAWLLLYRMEFDADWANDEARQYIFRRHQSQIVEDVKAFPSISLPDGPKQWRSLAEKYGIEYHEVRLRRLTTSEVDEVALVLGRGVHALHASHSICEGTKTRLYFGNPAIPLDRWSPSDDNT